MYINNIIIFLNSLNNYFKYFYLVFKKLSDYNICLLLKKSFINYLLMTLLSQ